MRLAIFGLGFVGAALREHAVAAGHAVDGFSRGGGAGDGVRFDASEADCGAALPAVAQRDYDTVVVTFPPGVAHASFWPALETLSTRRILLGSTGVYQRAAGEDCPVITEDTPLSELHPRVGPERAFLHRGGLVVRLAGLFGPLRNPVHWILDGRVGSEQRQANLVHVDDVARALLALAAHPRPQALYNLSDGQRHSWREIVDFCVARRVPLSLEPQPLKRSDSFVSAERLLGDLEGFSFTDFWSLLEGLAAEAMRR